MEISLEINRIDWDLVPLGEKSDAEIGRLLGIPSSKVAYQRTQRGIPAASKFTFIDWDQVSDMGAIDDTSLATRLGVNPSKVAYERRKRGIPPLNRPKSIKWDEEPLGQVPDLQLAEKLGCSAVSVGSARKARGIEPFGTVAWTELPIGEVPDDEVARSIGRSKSHVARNRRQRGIRPAKNYKSPTQVLPNLGRLPLGAYWRGIAEKARERLGITPGRFEFCLEHLVLPDYKLADLYGVTIDDVCSSQLLWQRQEGAKIEWEKQLLGLTSDTAIARALAVPKHRVKSHRVKRKIAAYRKIVWEELPLGAVSDAELAAAYGLSVGACFKARSRRGIAAFNQEHREPQPLDGAKVIDWKKQPLGLVSDGEIARTLQVSTSRVFRARASLNIPAFEIPLVEADERLLGFVTDSTIARYTGVSEATIRRRRLKLGLRSQLERLYIESKVLSSAKDESSLALDLKVSPMLIRSIRQAAQKKGGAPGRRT